MGRVSHVGRRVERHWQSQVRRLLLTLLSLWSLQSLRSLQCLQTSRSYSSSQTWLLLYQLLQCLLLLLLQWLLLLWPSIVADCTLLQALHSDQRGQLRQDSPEVWEGNFSAGLTWQGKLLSCSKLRTLSCVWQLACALWDKATLTMFVMSSSLIWSQNRVSCTMYLSRKVVPGYFPRLSTFPASI